MSQRLIELSMKELRGMRLSPEQLDEIALSGRYRKTTQQRAIALEWEIGRLRLEARERFLLKTTGSIRELRDVASS